MSTAILTRSTPSSISTWTRRQLTTIAAARRTSLGHLPNSNSSTQVVPRTTTATIPTTTIRWHGGPSIPNDAPTVPITFLNPHPSKSRSKQQQQQQQQSNDDSNNNDKITVEARIGETLLQTAHRHSIDLEGACEGVCACSTCHIILTDEALYDSLPEPSEDEEDMLDMAFGLTATSRLGCQVEVTEAMGGMVVQLPSATRNFYVDGHVPQPH